MTADLRQRLRRIDPAPVDAEPPSGAMDAAAVLHEIERRIGMDTRDTTNRKATPPDITQRIEPSATPKASERLTKETGKRRWAGVFVGVVAFAVVLIAVGAVILLASLGSDEVAPATTQAPPTITRDEALAVSGDYIEAFNTGDAESMLTLFTPDVTLSERSTGGPFEEMDRESFELQLAWDTAQGTIFTSPECAVTEEGTGTAVTVSCEGGTHSAPAQAVGAPPVPTVLTMVVTADGIRQLAFEYGEPDFLLRLLLRPRGNAPAQLGASFDGWLLANHRDDAGVVGFGNWATIEQAERGGRLAAQYAQEWAAFLEANNCDYQSVVCRPLDQ